MNKFIIPPKLLLITYGPEILLGHYVYVWLDCQQPFYVGVGTNRRAWNDHLPLPENRRRLSKHFRVKILRHQLTKPNAHTLEKQVMAFYRRRGNVLLNERG